MTELRPNAGETPTDGVDFAVDGAVATIRINRPRAANALSADVRERLLACVERLEAMPRVRAVILTGAGEKVFAAGSDIREMLPMTASQSVALSESIQRLASRLAALPQPVVCAVNGWCLGGGLELALACDIRIAADHARFGLPEARIGIMTGGGGLPRLVRIVGGGAARAMALTGDVIDARRAHELGLVWLVCERSKLLDEARALAGRIASLSPVALAQIKRTMAVVENADLASGIRAEAQACAVCFTSDDKAEGMQAFLEKRQPDFRGDRRDAQR